MTVSRIVPETDKMVIDVSEACYEEIRRKLVEAGNPCGVDIIDRGYGLGCVINFDEVVIRNGYSARHDSGRAA